MRIICSVMLARALMKQALQIYNVVHRRMMPR